MQAIFFNAKSFASLKNGYIVLDLKPEHKTVKDGNYFFQIILDDGKDTNTYHSVITVRSAFHEKETEN